MITFNSMPNLMIQKYSPSFYHQDADFYIIKHHDKDAGLLSIKALSNKTAELGLLVFLPFRSYFMTPSKCKKILQFVYKKGIKNVIICTYLESMKKLCFKFNFQYLFTQENKHWMKLEFNQGLQL